MPPAITSRRSRSWRPYLAVAAPACLVLALAALFGVRAWVYGFLRSDDFRRFLDRKASAFLQADGRLAPLQWQNAEVYSDAFDAVGDAASPWSRLNVEQVRARLDLAALWHRVWRVERIDIEKVNAALGDPALAKPNPAAASEVKPGEEQGGGVLSRLLPSRVEVGEVRVNDLSLRWPAGGLSGARVTARPSDSGAKNWEIDGAGGRLAQAHFPAVELSRFDVKSSLSDVFLTRAEGRSDSGGRLELSGRQSLDGERALDLTARFDALPIEDFLPGDWRARLHGRATGTVRITGGTTDGWKARGNVVLNEGRLETLPILDELAILTASERFRQIPLQKGHADFDWAADRVVVSNLLVESEGLLRIEGGFTVRGDQIDGTLQVGVARGSLRWVEGVSARVFNLPERDGYLWTTTRLSGPARHPTEDLTPRLIAAAQQEVIEKARNGAGAVIDTAGSLLDLLRAR